MNSLTEARVGPPPTILCIGADAAQNPLAELLSDRESAHAHRFIFRRYEPGSAKWKLALPPEFWKHFSRSAGLAVDLGTGSPQLPMALLEMLTKSEEREGCPMIARISDLQLDRKVTVVDFLGFYWRVCALERADVAIWIDGDIGRMDRRASNLRASNFRFGWKTVYPPTLSWIEQQLDGFLESALHHHEEIWQPFRVHLKIGFS